MLEQQELSEILRRAQEIENHSPSDASLSSYQETIDAAVEAGISRDAAVQAIRERLGIPVATPEAGQLVFARSADGNLYPARVQSFDSKGARVQFMNGTSATLQMADLRELMFIPGLKLNYKSHSGGWWMAEVVRFNEPAQAVTVSCWGQEETVSLEHIRLKVERPGSLAGRALVWRIIEWLAVGGGGILLGYLLHR